MTMIWSIAVYNSGITVRYHTPNMCHIRKNKEIGGELKNT